MATLLLAGRRHDFRKSRIDPARIEVQSEVPGSFGEPAFIPVTKTLNRPHLRERYHNNFIQVLPPFPYPQINCYYQQGTLGPSSSIRENLFTPPSLPVQHSGEVNSTIHEVDSVFHDQSTSVQEPTANREMKIVEYCNQPVTQSPRCRFCLKDKRAERLLNICKCDNDMRFAHRSCVQRSIKVNNNTECEMCHHKFGETRIEIEIPSEEQRVRPSYKKSTRYVCSKCDWSMITLLIIGIVVMTIMLNSVFIIICSFQQNCEDYYYLLEANK